MSRSNDVIMAKSIYDDNEILPEALVISKQTGLNHSLINPDMERSNNRNHDTNAHSDDCNGCCDGCCEGCCDNDTLLLLCCICYVCDD